MRLTECFSMYSLMSRRVMALLVVEHELGQRLGQLGLAHAGGAEEQERADRPVGVLQAGAGPAHGVGDGGQRLLLADHAAAQAVLHAQQLLALALQHLLDRHAGPAGDDGGDLLGVDHLGGQLASSWLSAASASARRFSSCGISP